MSEEKKLDLKESLCLDDEFKQWIDKWDNYNNKIINDAENKTNSNATNEQIGTTEIDIKNLTKNPEVAEELIKNSDKIKREMPKLANALGIK